MAKEKLYVMASSLPSFNIWLPNQKTRDAVIQWLVETLSSPSILSKHYGEGAISTMRVIEDKASLAASDMLPASASDTTTDDPIAWGIETLQVFSNKICQLVLVVVKFRAFFSEKLQSSPLADVVAVPTYF